MLNEMIQPSYKQSRVNPAIGTQLPIDPTGLPRNSNSVMRFRLKQALVAQKFQLRSQHTRLSSFHLFRRSSFFQLASLPFLLALYQVCARPRSSVLKILSGVNAFFCNSSLYSLKNACLLGALNPIARWMLVGSGQRIVNPSTSLL